MKALDLYPSHDPGHSPDHYAEDALIAYQMGEMASAAEAAAVLAQLEGGAVCAEAAEAIAETLRVFSAGPVRVPNAEHAWGRLRGSLPALTVTPARTKSWRWVWAPALLGCLVAGVLEIRGHREQGREVAVAGAPLKVGPLGVGPLSAEPRDPALAAHLAAAERLLTELRHQPAGEPLDAGVRAEAEGFRVKNAAWVRESRAAGDGTDASVLEAVDRTLTALGHAPGRAEGRVEDKGWHVRFAMNTDGLLLDLRVLEQNDAQGKD